MRAEDSYETALVNAFDELRSGGASAEVLEAIFSAETDHPQPSRNIAVRGTVLERHLIRSVITPLREAFPVEEPLLDSFLRMWPYYRADHGQSDLKKKSVLWLLQRGARDIRVERPYCAGRYDVAAEDLRIVVECGHTRVDKLLDVALNGSWRVCRRTVHCFAMRRHVRSGDAELAGAALNSTNVL